MVSMIVSAYNEEETIAESIKSLKKIDYPKNLLEIVIINDGSTDNTAKIIKKYANDRCIAFIDNNKNKGKAACLNQGIRGSKGEFVAVMDADSEVSKNILKKTIPYFKETKVGAVTATVQVKNPNNLLQKVIEIEYILGLSLALKALSYFNGLHVTPGPFSIYRKTMLHKIGLFDINNITEDLEIAHRIQKYGYRIECCTTTQVKTVTPGTIKSLYVQRKRWYSGSLMTFWQHKNIFFNSKIGSFSFIVPYMLLLVIFGLALVMFSTYLGLSKLFESISFYTLTNFNFLSYFSLKNIDLLALNGLTIFAIMAILTTITVAFIGIKFTNKKLRTKMPGILGFVFLFFLYQVFWTSSFYTVLFKRKLKWR